MTRARDLADGADKDITGTLTLDDIVLSNDMSVADDGKVQFGAGNDLQIYHEASSNNSIIAESGSGNLRLHADDLYVFNAAGTSVMISALDTGKVGLGFSGSEKLATNSTGVDITGGFTATDGCTITTTGSEELNLELISTNADANKGPVISFHRNSSSPANSDVLAELNFNGENDASEKIDYVDIFAQAHNVADGSEEGGLTIRSMVGGTLRSRMNMYGSTTKFNDNAQDIDFIVESSGNANMINVDAGNDLVGIGGVPDTSKLTVYGQVGTTNGTASSPTHSFYSDVNTGMFRPSGDHLGFSTGGTERLRIDNGGNVLVNQTSTSSPGFSNTTTGLCFSDTGRVFSSASGAASSFNRNTSDGGVIHIRKAGTLVGVLSVTDSDNFSIDCQTSSHSGLTFGTANILPRVNGSNNDNNVDLGSGSNRFLNIYATNNAIQTSDETEKQNIASLTNAEITAAKAISKLFKTFKWKHRVSEEGDAARTHSGVIAQEVQTAMTDAGLDASKYAFWCSDTWWETSTEVAAVEADEEAGVEAKDAYTRIDTYQTADEAPEGATERTRLGIRYAELMAFVGAATEQRLADIETRLTALEAAT